MDKLLSLMGLCRRAGKLGIGHDAVFDEVRRGRAKAVILTSDASGRHERELEAAAFPGRVLHAGFTMEEAGLAVGKRSCIFSVEDDGFANAMEKTL